MSSWSWPLYLCPGMALRVLLPLRPHVMRQDANLREKLMGELKRSLKKLQARVCCMFMKCCCKTPPVHRLWTQQVPRTDPTVGQPS